MRPRSLAWGVLTGLLIVAAVALGLLSYGMRDAADDSGASAGYKGVKLDVTAPAFELTDQNGSAVSLADYRGKVVVLTLLDPVCTDICPVYANHYRLAYNALDEEEREEIVFLAFNANDRKTSVEDVMSATEKWGLDRISTFHFLTGSPEELADVWGAYNVEASGDPKPGKPDELQHSPAVFLIDQSGQLRRFLSTNFEGAPPLSALIVERARALLNEGWW